MAIAAGRVIGDAGFVERAKKLGIRIRVSVPGVARPINAAMVTRTT